MDSCGHDRIRERHRVREGHREPCRPGLAPYTIPVSQLGASAKHGYVMVTATVKITQTRRTVSRWPAGHPRTPVLTTPQSACPLTSCVMAMTTVETAQMRESSAVRPGPRRGPGRGVGRVAGQGVWARARAERIGQALWGEI